jgi:transposase
MRSLCTLHGYRLKVGVHVPAQVRELGNRLPPHLAAEVLREYARWQGVNTQLQALEAELRAELAQEAPEPAVALIHHLMQLCAIGDASGRLFVREFFGWRRFANRRQLAAAAGLTGTPYASGTLAREQGISKAGNRRIRAILIEIAWGWLRYQPDSPLSQWFQERFAGSARLRRIGIVALARRLLIDLWRYLKDGVIPAGVKFKAGVLPEGVRVKAAVAAAA